MNNLTISYSLADVFTRDRFCGNQVAVVHDASALNTSQMQNIAREFGFSETTFIFPPADEKYYAQVRIFTPLEEVPFAGHPNIGTVFIMGTQATAARGPFPDVAVLNEKGGDVHVRPIWEDGHVVGAEIDAPQRLQRMGTVSTDLVARCLGLTTADLKLQHFEPCVASLGLPFAFVELRNLDALATVETDVQAFHEAAQLGPRTVDEFAICAFVVMSDAEEKVVIRSRVVCPLGHPVEDPATGSASGALAALLTEAMKRKTTAFQITQGVEMGRRSEINVTVSANGGPVSIRGYCVAVGTGTMIV